MEKKYAAYVGSYNSTGNALGITIYDIDMKHFGFEKRGEMEVSNSSYIITAHSKKILYSISDTGIHAFKIEETGDLRLFDFINIKGLRGCHLSTDIEDRHLFVSGYHDGKITTILLCDEDDPANGKEDGGFIGVVSSVYHKGLGSAVRTFRPHVTCTKRTPNGRFVMAVDSGQDFIKVYQFDKVGKNLKFCDLIQFDAFSAPKYISFTSDRKFMYVLTEWSNQIFVFSYDEDKVSSRPIFKQIQSVYVTGKQEKLESLDHTPIDDINNIGLKAIMRSSMTKRAATCMTFTQNEKYLLCGSEGDNTVSVYERNPEDGKLRFLFVSPISGEYPKDIVIFPDDKHFVSVNQNSNELTFFKINYEKKIITMCSKTIPVSQPNCGVIVEV